VTVLTRWAASLLRQGTRHPLAALAGTVLILVVLLAASAGAVDPGSPGADSLGQLAAGARSSLLAGLIGVAVSLTAGTLCGFIVAVNSGRFDTIIDWAAYLIASVPALIFMIVTVADSGDSLVASMAVFGILMTAPFFILARGTALAVEGQPAIQARRVLGLTFVRMIVRSVVPALRAELTGLAFLVCALMVSIHALLGFLGLGGTTNANWGYLLRLPVQHLPDMQPRQWLPAVVLLLTVLSLTTLGLTIRRAHQREAADNQATEHQRGDVDTACADEPLPSTWFRSSAMVDVRGLRVRSGPTEDSPEIVSNVSLTIARGESVALLGEPRSGSLEIGLAIAGLLSPRRLISGGSILFAGTELVGMPERELGRLRGTRISYLPQQPVASLDPARTVGSHLLVPLRKTLGLSRSASTRMARELLVRVGFNDPDSTLALYPRELTGVLAQRVLIAGAVSCLPDLLVANDPTASLDPLDEAAILALLNDLQAELDFTLVLLTTSVAVISASCRQVAVVQAGMIVEHASLQELLASPQHPYTRQLVKAVVRDRHAQPPSQGQALSPPSALRQAQPPSFPPT